MNYERLSREHFDRQATEYDQRDTWYYSREGKISCRDIVRRLKVVEYESLLDIGCGTGFLADLLQSQKQAEYVGIDISPRMIEVARSKLIPNTTFIVGAANRLPFPKNRFDIVTCSQSFHHYPYQHEAMAEAWRVLKPDGLYILSDSGFGGLCAWFDNHILFKLLRSGDCCIQSREAVEQMMHTAGFDIVESCQLSFMIYTVVGRK